MMTDKDEKKRTKSRSLLKIGNMEWQISTANKVGVGMKKDKICMSLEVH